MKPELFQTALDKLKESGFRLTQIRKDLISFILNRAGHWTVQELVQEVQKKFPSIGVATVYRTVNLLAGQKALSETLMTNGASRYEVSPEEHHDHLTCLTCGEIFEFENDKIEELQQSVANKLGFDLIDHRMELFGECKKPKCKFRFKRLSSS